ncbi:hypothetical protein B0H17DRAFT_1088307 [Mycena rosella]|uniref:Uncharacterized protein n=1 Tax=Mycena rosella TaxID=1033263 RepID=A0AAD7CY75_MYCRO|nr:hypothetical protein B0H17DRAFT_1088307 [Mycena rosella]
MQSPHTIALPQTDRAHLIRSTRKLGAFLGETPLVDDSRSHSPTSSVSSVSSTESTASKRSGRIFAPALKRSSSIVDPHSNPNPKFNMNININARHERPTLYLHLAAPTSTASPISPTSPTFSPREPSFGPASTRRRKMAKLARTLGRDVPPALVFSNADAKAKAKYIPSPVVVPALLAALAPAHPSPRSPASPSSLASPTREATASAMSYQHSSLLSPRAASAMNMRRRNYDSEERDRAWSPASSSPSPRTPHYVRASPPWNAEFAQVSPTSLATPTCSSFRDASSSAARLRRDLTRGTRARPRTTRIEKNRAGAASGAAHAGWGTSSRGCGGLR